MADPIAALLGLEIDDEEKTRALADTLRGRKRAADFFSLSTVDPIARGAQAEAGDVLASAKTAGSLRQTMANREQQQRLQDERLEAARQAATLADQRSEAAKVAAEDRARARLIEDREYETGQKRYGELGETPETWVDPKTGRTRNIQFRDGEWIDVDSLLPANTSGMIPIDEYDAPAQLATSYEQPKTRAERDAFEKGDTDALALRTLASGWSEDFLPDIPKTGGMRNFLANYIPILTDKDSEDSARWWKNYQRQAELVQRHEMFGSALTKSEQQAWEAANIDPNIMNAETIRNALETRAALADKMAQHQAFTAIKKGYDPELIEQNYGSTVDVQRLLTPEGQAEYLAEMRERQARDREIQADTPRAMTYGEAEEARYQELLRKQQEAE